MEKPDHRAHQDLQGKMAAKEKKEFVQFIARLMAEFSFLKIPEVEIPEAEIPEPKNNSDTLKMKENSRKFRRRMKEFSLFFSPLPAF